MCIAVEEMLEEELEPSSQINLDELEMDYSWMSSHFLRLRTVEHLVGVYVEIWVP